MAFRDLSNVGFHVHWEGISNLGWNEDPSKKNILFAWLVENKRDPKKSKKSNGEKINSGKEISGVPIPESCSLSAAFNGHQVAAVGGVLFTGSCHAPYISRCCGAMFEAENSGTLRSAFIILPRSPHPAANTDLVRAMLSSPAERAKLAGRVAKQLLI